MNNKFQDIAEYYNYVNSKEFASIEVSSLTNEIQDKCDELPEDDKRRIQLEIDCLNFKIRNGEIRPISEWVDSNGMTIIYPDINSITEAQINYLKSRILNLSSKTLLSIFASVILAKINDYKYAQLAIDSYIELIEIYKKNDVQYPEKHYGLEISYILSNLFCLSFKYKYKTDELKNLTLELINNPNQQSSSFLKLRIDCICFLLEKCKNKKLSKDCLDGMENLCEQTLNMNLNFNFHIAFTELGLNISRLLQTNPNKWILIEAQYFEKLAKQSNGNLMAPQYCQRAITLYKELKMSEKVNEMYRKYENLTKNIKLSVHESKGINIKPYIEQIEKFAEENDSKTILDYMVFSSEAILNYQQIKDIARKSLSNNVLSAICSGFKIDEFGNKIGDFNTDEENLNKEIGNQYDVWFNFQAIIFYFLFTKAFSLKKIDSEIIIYYLKKTWFGVEQKEQLSTGEIYTYSWIDFIEEPITSFMNKFERLFIQKENMEHLFIQEIDSLSSKIEGIIRDIGRYSNLEDFRAFKFDDDNNYQLNNINKYLYDSNIAEVIDENDLEFFKYFLIDRRNLRNRVAHCMMLKSEYNIYNMIMLLFVIFRLSKYLQIKEEINEIE